MRSRSTLLQRSKSQAGGTLRTAPAADLAERLAKRGKKTLRVSVDLAGNTEPLVRAGVSAEEPREQAVPQREYRAEVLLAGRWDVVNAMDARSDERRRDERARRA